MEVNWQEEIGSSSTGMIVYNGTHNERNAAVKLLPKDSGAYLNANLQVLKENFEGKIVQFLGTRENEDNVELYMERCDFSLRDYFLYKKNPSDQDLARLLDSAKQAINGLNLDLREIMKDVIQGLIHLHKKTSHGDLKPGNILIKNGTNRWEAKIDMNISSPQGTVGWRSRELVRNLPLTRQSDCYSLGMVLFYCLTNGEHPFEGRTDGEREQGRVDRFELLKTFQERLIL